MPRLARWLLEGETEVKWPAPLVISLAVMLSACGGDGKTAPPALAESAEVEITLERGSCLGLCPRYDVVLRANGPSTYRGHEFVLFVGEHRLNVTRAEVIELAQRFRRGRFEQFQDEYRSQVTDIATNRIGIRIDGWEKMIVDHGGAAAGMPSTVVHLQEAVDQAASSESWTLGNDETIRRLTADRFVFQSPEGANLVARASLLSSESFVIRLIELGAATEAPATDVQGIPRLESSPLLNSIHRGHVSAVRALIEAGYWRRASAAEREEAVRRAERSGNAAMLEAVLAAQR